MRLGIVFLVLAAGCGDAFHGPCGNGALDPFEECDDGNIESGDLCSANCTREPSCGDRIIDSPSENCDDGNRVPGDNCDENCRTETVCGDLDIEPGEMCEDGNPDPGDGCSDTCTIEYKVLSKVTWKFVTAADFVDHGCPDGIDTIELTTQVLRSDDTVVREVVEMLPCDQGMRAKQWYVGRYRVLVRATDATGTAEYGAPIDAVIDLHTGQRDVLAQYVIDGGYAHFAWRLVDVKTRQPLSCADAGVDDMGIVATAGAFSRGSFAHCGVGQGMTQVLPAGDYQLSVTAIDDMATIGSEVGHATLPITIVAPSGVTEVGTIDVAIE